MIRSGSNNLFLIFVLGALAIEPAVAQRGLASQSGRFTTTSWNSESGLPQNWVECLLQTRDGYLWAGTRLGLARFDGLRFVTFKPEGAKVMVEDNWGDLWMGTKSGLFVLRGDRCERITKDDGLCHDEVTAFAVSATGGIWIGTGGGVSYYSEGRFVNFINEAADPKHVYSVVEEQDGNLLVGFTSGLFRLNRMTGTFEQVWHSEAVNGADDQNIVLKLYRDRNNGVWIGTYYGVYRMVDGQITYYELEESGGKGEIRAIFESSAGVLWVMSDNSLFQFENGRFSRTILRGALDSDSLRSICEDRDGNFWIGSAYGGLHRLRPRVVDVLTTRDGLAHNDVWSVSEGMSGTLWITSSLGVNRIQNGKIEMALPGPADCDLTMSSRSMIEDKFGGLWLATAFLGGWHLQKTNGVWIRVVFWSGHTQCRVVYEDHSGTVWMGTREGLVRLLPVARSYAHELGDVVNTHGEQWIYKPDEVIRASLYEHWSCRSGTWHYHPRDVCYHERPEQCGGSALNEGQVAGLPWTTNLIGGTLSNYDVRAIVQDRNGDVWFATAGGGLNRFREGRFSAFTTSDGLISNDTWALHEDEDGALWIGSRSGLTRLKDGRIFNITKEHGLFENFVNQILEDDFDNLWIGCKRGIFRVSRKALNDVAEGRSSSVNCISFGEADGMLASETNGQMQPAGCKTRDGRLWFPTIQGLVVIDPSKVRENRIPPDVIIEEMHVNDSVVFLDGHTCVPGKFGAERTTSSRTTVDGRHSKIELPPGGGNWIEIRFTATSLSVPEKVRFRYRLEGQSQDWREADRRMVYFTHLRPGDYRFEVKACNDQGVWNDTGASLAFHIAPYFYQTKWFPLLCGLATVALGYGLRGWTARRQRQIQELKSQLLLEKERARIAEEIHDDLGAHLTQIGMLAQLAKRFLDSPGRAGEHVQKIATTAREGAQSLNEIVWALNPRNDTVRSLAAFLRRHAKEYLSAAEIECEFSGPERVLERPVAAVVRHQVFLILREALNNVVRHSRATLVGVNFAISRSELLLQIRDNGGGFDIESARRANTGNGLTNLERRAASIGGTLTIESTIGAGTAIRLSVPLGRGDSIESR